jgi:type IX secretion system PorP/SprF family membrane protein
MFNGFLLNPAYCGSQGALNITGLYRNQWVGIEGAPVSKSFAANSPLKNKKLNIGVIIENERFAVYDQTRISAAYAYRVKALGGQLAFGLQAGAQLNSISWNKMVINNVSDPNFASMPQKSTSFISGAGLYYHSRSFYAGFSAPQFYNSNIHSNPTLVFNCGGLISAGENYKLKPAALVKYIHSSPVSVNGSLTLYYKELIGIGGGYTPGNSWMVLTDIRITEQFHFGYGYDRSLNKLKTYSGGSHEIMLRYLFSYKLKVQSARYF